MSTRMPYSYYYEASSVKDSAADEDKRLAPLEAATSTGRHKPGDEQSSSRAKMWDPVKDCSDPRSTQTNTTGFPRACHSSGELSVYSAAGDSTSMGLQLPHSHHLYDHAQESQQQLTNWGSRGPASTGLSPYDHDAGSRYRGSASMGLLPNPQLHAMASVYPVDVSMYSQPSQVNNQFDRFQYGRQYQPGYEDPLLRDGSRQNSQPYLDSISRGAAIMGMQPYQAGNFHDRTQETGQQYVGVESGMPTSTAYHESTLSRQSSSSAIPSPSSQILSDLERASQPQRPSPSAGTSQAMEVARFAERLDQQSNREDAMRAYKQACDLFQDVIIRSYSLEERMDCNAARNNYQARLDVLLRESAASPPNLSPEQNDQQDNQQDDDGPGGGKPQYSLYEDWALCRKLEEGLSWQDVAESSVFKGRRKHRSLSQRKHTIGKMGPKYHEPEEPWTEEENQKLCALGDAGKTLGDIHRKFRSRNAERCLDRYFFLKGYHITGPSRTHASHQAGHPPA